MGFNSAQGGGAGSVLESAHIRQSVGQSLGSSTSWTILTGGTWVQDSNHGLTIDLSTGKITVANDGNYAIAGWVAFQTASATGTRGVSIYKNGSLLLNIAKQSPAGSDVVCFQDIVDFIDLSANDYLQVAGFQTSGSPMTLVGQISVTRLH